MCIRDSGPLAAADAELVDVAVAHDLVAAAQHTGVAQLRTEVVVPQVGVGVEVDDVEAGVFLRHGPHRTQRHQMLTAQQEMCIRDSAQGINTNFNIVLGLAVSNALVALSGALLSQYQGFADVGMGRGAIVIGLAAVIIGEAVFGRIFHNFALKMVSVSLGAIIYYIVIQLVLTLGFDANL